MRYSTLIARLLAAGLSISAFGAGTALAQPTNPPKPVIDSFSPTHGKVGDSVTIYGQYFYHNPGHTTVQFTGADAVAPYGGTSDETTIYVYVPTNAQSGPITVSTGDGTNTFGSAVSTNAFTVDTNPPPGGVISLSGDLAFGNVTVGTSAQRTLTIANIGNSNLTVNALSCPSGFSGNWPGGTITASNSQNVTISFSPTAATTYSGAISVDSDAAGGSNTIGVSGTGISPESRIISLSGNLAFGNVQVGASAQRTLTITNSGNAILRVNALSCPSGFTVSGNWPVTVTAGGSHDVTISFSPTAATTYSGTISAISDATGGANTIPISGAGTNPVTRIIYLSGDLAFGDVEVGASAERTLTITNSGDGPLTVTGLSCPSGFSVSGKWSGTVTAGGSTNVTISFSPAAATNYSGAISAISDATSGFNSISVSGAGTNEVTGIISLSGNLAFGNVKVGASAQRTLTIANHGTASLTVNGLSCPSGFSGNWSGTVAAGGSHDVTISFSPRAATYYSGAIWVSSDATNGASTISVSGAGGTLAPTGKTNWVQTFNFTLTGWAQNQSKPTAISTKNVVAALSGATVRQMLPPSQPGGPPTVTNVILPTFVGSEKLLTKQLLGSTNPPQVLVRQGAGKSQTDWDVSSAFVPAADTANKPPITFVSAGLTNYHGITTFAFAGNSNVLSFVVSGLMAASDTTAKSGSATYYPSKGLTATVAGTGTIGTTTNVFGGTVSMAGGHLE